VWQFLFLKFGSVLVRFYINRGFCRLSFQPIVVETLGPINEHDSDFFSVLAKKISHHSGDERVTAFFVPARFHASAAIQRSAATWFLCVWGLPGVMVTLTIFFYFFQTPWPWDSWYRGYKKNNDNKIWIYIAPYGRNFKGAGGRSDQCSVKVWVNKKVSSLDSDVIGYWLWKAHCCF